jgi:hypothetical protein
VARPLLKMPFQPYLQSVSLPETGPSPSRIFFGESHLSVKFSAKKKTLGEEFFAESQIFFKKSLFHFPNFSILNMHLYKAYVQI